MKTDGHFYTQKLLENNYDEALQNCIKDACKYCIDNTFNADEEKKKQPIMMLGKIQSGKTRAFTGLISMAFDNNFDMVFILTKNSKALVKQTEMRMKREFKKFIDEHSIFVTDIMKANSHISGYQLENKNIIIAKKQKDNLSKVIEFIEKYSITSNKKCLIIDDEADTTGIGYNKEKDSDEFTLRMVASKVNEIRGTLDGCVFVQVTATPYALYLQPEFNEDCEPKPIKPQKTVLVPYGEGYIGGEYYFIDSKNLDHPAQFLFEPMKPEEHELVSMQKRKGKKSKIDDRRCFKEEEIISRRDKLPIFKKGIVNFILGGIILREIDRNSHYSYVIHTATQTGSHISLQNVADIFLQQIKNRNDLNIVIIEELIYECYEGLKKSVISYNHIMPNFDYVKAKFYEVIDKEYYSIDIVNSDSQVDNLLNEETGELNLLTPFSIFVGGQVLDRGVTIPNMIGFYYGRNPKTMQQDTVLQHSRMFGYRKKLLPVTRFYTTERIHSNMEKITEIDLALREDIESGKQGNGVYFVTKKDEEKVYEYGNIKPCAPEKIKISDIILLKPHNRILPVGFMPSNSSKYKISNAKIKAILNNCTDDFFTLEVNINDSLELVKAAYDTLVTDEDTNRFITLDEFITTFKYMLKDNNKISVVVKLHKNNSKYRKSGRIEDSPATGEREFNTAKEHAINKPALLLLQEEGNSEDWGFRQFWWPILVSPLNVPKTIYASKVAAEKVKV